MEEAVEGGPLSSRKGVTRRKEHRRGIATHHTKHGIPLYVRRVCVDMTRLGV